MVNAFSIIVTCQDQRLQLNRLLPQLLSVEYSGECEVIVVDMQHDKDTAEWLEEMEVHHPNLSHTFCPASSRGIDIYRLALTLGAKAANYDWLAIVPADTVLPGRDWLDRLAACCGDDIDVVKGITGRKHRWRRLLSRIFRRWQSIFVPTSSILLCRRSILFQGPARISKKRITYLPL